MPRKRAIKPVLATRGRTPVSAGPRIALYHRVSTLDQDPDLPAFELHAYADRQGGKVVIDEREQASGAWNGRPGLQRVLAAARSGEVDTVVVWKLDRFGRSALDLLVNIEALESAGTRFVAVMQGLEIRPDGGAMSRLLLTMLASIAEFERSLIRERTMLGIQRARDAGKSLGRPLGDGPSPSRVAALRRRGKSWADVAAELDCTVAMARRRAATDVKAPNRKSVSETRRGRTRRASRSQPKERQ